MNKDKEQYLNQFSKIEIETAELNTNRFMDSVAANSIVSMERPNRIRELIFEGCLGQKTPYILNWICPRGTELIPDELSGKLYRKFTTTPSETGFKTDYQILPKLELERNLSRNLDRFSTNTMYLKIVADDNPFCLYPASLRIDGVEKTMNSISNYAKYCQEQFETLISRGNIFVDTWSNTLGEKMFQEYLNVFENTRYEDLLEFLPKDILKTEIDILTSHTKPSKEAMPYFEKFAQDCIVYYAVEGLFLNKIYDDNVILAWNDSTKTARTIDALRLKNGLPVLPKIYVLHEKRKGKILNDF